MICDGLVGIQLTDRVCRIGGQTLLLARKVTENFIVRGLLNPLFQYERRKSRVGILLNMV